MLSKLRIWVSATTLAVLSTSGAVVASHAAETPPTTPPFTDVATSHTFSKETSWLAAEGVSTGYTNGNGTKRFEPSGAVLREQMAAFLYRLAGSPTYSAPATSLFTDVPHSHTFYKEISWLAQEKISTGYANGNGTWSFRPSQPVLREQMAAFLYRYANGEQDPPTFAWFYNDIAEGDTFYAEMRWLIGREISTGYSDRSGRTFRPAQPVLREQMAAFMFRLRKVSGGLPQIEVPATLSFPLGSYSEYYLTVADRRAGTWTIDAGELPSIIPGTHPAELYFNGTHIYGEPTRASETTITLAFTDGRRGRATREVTIRIYDPVTVAPSDTVTRATLAGHVYRCEGADVELPSVSPFADLWLDDPRFPAVYWAHENQVITAEGEAFNPDEVMTRREVARHLFVYAGPPGYTTRYSQSVDIRYDDPDVVATSWAVTYSAMLTTHTGYFFPDRLATVDDATRFRQLVSCADVS